MRSLYFFVIKLYQIFIGLASPFYFKAKLWKLGRRNLWKTLLKKCHGKQKIIWFHCASLGEFEQGKPLMVKIHEQHPDITILVTFFSPSGYEIKKTDSCAEIITYLPMDTMGNAMRFLEIVNPIAAIFVKYEYWYGYMEALSLRNIPFYYISAIYRQSQIFFKPYGKWFVNQLSAATHIFVQNEDSRKLLQMVGISQVSVAGDTRFDQVARIAQNVEPITFVQQFKDNYKLIVAGSTWLPDEQVLKELFIHIANNYKLIIAPHEIDENHVSQIKKLFAPFGVIALSDIDNANFSEYKVLIINKIGILKKIYQYSNISYIGGAFQTGLHNILEAAVYGVPIFFGPHYGKFDEAKRLVAREGAFSIRNSEELYLMIKRFMEDNEYYQKCCKTCQEFVKENLGAAEMMYSHIKDKL